MLDSQLDCKKNSNKGRPSTKVTINSMPSGYWTGDEFCVLFMSTLSRICAFHYRYVTGIKAKYKDQEDRNNSSKVNEHNEAKSTILKYFNLSQDTKYLLIKKQPSFQQQIEVTANDEIITEEIKDFVVNSERIEFQTISEKMNKIKRLLEPQVVENLQTLLAIYVFDQELMIMKNCSEEELHISSKLIAQKCVNEMVKDKKKFNEFFNLQLIRKYIDFSIYSEEETRQSHKNDKDQKMIKKFEESRRKQSQSDQKEFIKEYKEEIEKDNEFIKAIVEQILYVWDDILLNELKNQIK